MTSQELRSKKFRDILTPANAITLTGLGLTIYGSVNLHTAQGFIAIVVGRLFDMLDGLVARHTRTSSFGATLDAASDKFAALAMVIAAWYYQVVPLWLLIFMLLQHLTVAIVTLYGMKRGIALHVTQMGKNNMFLHMLTLITFVGAQLLDGQVYQLINTLAYCLAGASVVHGLWTTYDYIQKYVWSK